MAIEKILVVDDEILVRNFLAETLRRRGIEVVTAENGQKAFNILKENVFDLVITDMKMPDLTGIDVLKRVKELSPGTIVVVITAFGSIENAVEAMKLGAFNYLIKPFSPDTIEAVIEKAQEHISLVEENNYLRQQAAPGGAKLSQRVVGESPVMKKIYDEILTIAKSNASVFISGESGTGKEVVAHLIHYNSLRTNKPFIKVNCAAIPETLVESEFFGHEKGAFTGANLQRRGRFELANGGSLMLDEVTEVPAGLQAKLLRITQEQEFERVGGSKVIKVDVRLISTTNRNIKEAIEQKVLREDLYYRLNVVPIHLPPLRDRKEDIIPLAHYFIEKFSIENHREKKKLTNAAEKKLLSYSWPGNIRELGNIIERAIVLNQSNKIDAENLHIENSVNSVQRDLPTGLTLEELEKRFIIETLQANHNDKTKTAKTLGISVKTLSNRLSEYRISEA